MIRKYPKTIEAKGTNNVKPASDRQLLITKGKNSNITQKQLGRHFLRQVIKVQFSSAAWGNQMPWAQEDAEKPCIRLNFLWAMHGLNARHPLNSPNWRTSHKIPIMLLKNVRFTRTKEDWETASGSRGLEIQLCSGGGASCALGAGRCSEDKARQQAWEPELWCSIPRQKPVGLGTVYNTGWPSWLAWLAASNLRLWRQVTLPHK